MMYLQLFGGLTWLLLGGDLLVRGAVALSKRFDIPPILVGLTVVAFGTSAPELFIAIQAALAGFPGIAIGNVVGSNIANVLLVVGAPAMIYPMACDQRSARRDGFVMALVSVLFTALCIAGPLGSVDGAVLLVCLSLFLAYSARSAIRSPVWGAREAPELERVLGLPTQRRMIAFFLVVGGIGLPLGAHLLVEGAVEIASALGVSNAVIGLTVVAVGTSLPELATTFVADVQRHSDVAVGNILGSNIMNIVAIMGLTALIAPEPIPVPAGFLSLDLPVMVGSALALGFFTWTRRPVGRVSGAVLVVLYVLYVVALFEPA